MRLLVLATLLLTAPLAFVPAGTAAPDCIQVYPWSRLCEGDLPIAANCIAMSPFWELCNGNVPGAVNWVVGQVLP